MKQQDGILADARGFMKSRVILTAAELDLFTLLHERKADARDLAKEKDLDPRAAVRLLASLVTFGLVEIENGRYGVTEKGALLSSRHPESVLPMVLHQTALWESWSHLTESLKEGRNPAERKPLTERGDGTLKAFIGAMHVVGRELAQEIADSYDASSCKRFLDIGGGSGTYTIAFLKKNPKMRGVLFDLEKVIPLAEERLGSEGLLDRVELAAGNFYRDELPGGCDLALLSAIIHQNSPDENLVLYRKVHRALVPGGAMLIRDHIMNESRTRPPAGALFALNMLVATNGGDTYTFREVRESLEEAGFVGISLVRSGERMDCLVEARKPKGR